MRENISAAAEASVRTAGAVAVFLLYRCLGSKAAGLMPSSFALALTCAVSSAAACLLSFSFRGKGVSRADVRDADQEKPWARGAIFAVAAALIALDLVVSVLAGTQESTSVPSPSDVAAAMLLYPAAEELFFRGALLSLLLPTEQNYSGGKWSRAYGVAVQAVLFGAIHTSTAFLTATAAGVLFGMLTVRHEVRNDLRQTSLSRFSNKFRRLPLRAAFAHALYNGAVCASRAAAAYTASPMAGVLTAAAVSAALAAVACVCRFIKSRFIKKEGENSRD